MTFRIAWTCVLLILVGGALAGEAGKLAVSPEKDWPQWRGPRRDGICDEKGLLRSWPEGGPRLLWSVEGLGYGYSCPIVVNDTIYLTGDVDEELHLFALRLDGSVKWKTTNGKAWRASYPGARACFLYDDGRLYHMNAHGRVVCLDPADGKEIWAVEALQRFEAKNINWGHSECLMADGPRLIVSPGGRKAAMAALDKKTGQTVWASEPITFQKPDGTVEVDNASYASPILFELGGRRHIVNVSARHVFGADADTGKILWKRPMITRYQVLGITPVLVNDAVFMTGPDGKGGTLYRMKVRPDGVDVEEAWHSSLDTCHGGVIYVDGLLKGAWYRPFDGWGCVDPATGEALHRTRDLPMGAALHADGLLYCLSETGTMALVDANAREFRIISSFPFVDAKRKKDAWAHPVIHQGRLYLRYHEKLCCYDVKAPAAP